MPDAATSDPVAGLFNLDRRCIGEREAVFAVELDAQEPYLSDHRPGGHPLFPTAMAIELAVVGANALAPTAGQGSVLDIEVYKPFVLDSDQYRTIDLHVVRSEAAGVFDCTLSSSREGRLLTHLRAKVRLDVLPAPTSARSFAWEPNTAVGPVVSSAQVYELFFHGPSFQVIGEARCIAGKLQSRLRPNLPPSHRITGASSQMAPRLVEFALQSAGLLEIATTGRMQIPHSIESVTRPMAVDVDEHPSLYATARYASKEGDSIDICIVNDVGQPVLAVTGYRTVTLPFGVSAAKVAQLRRQLRGM